MLGTLGLLAILISVFLVCAGAASGPSEYVPGRTGGWPAWMAGPLRGLGVGVITASSFQTLTLITTAGYLAVLVASRALSMRSIAVTILAANLILLLGPPLISQDVFGYLAFARLGVVHGLDPYTHVFFEAPTDPIYPFIGWPYQNSPYGPLFTLGSYATAPLGLGGGLWALKAIAVAGSLLAVWLTARAAGALGRSRRFAAVFLGLNPVMLETRCRRRSQRHARARIPRGGAAADSGSVPTLPLRRADAGRRHGHQGDGGDRAAVSGARGGRGRV